MTLSSLTVGSIGTNCYILYDEKTLDAAVIDPGDNAKPVADRIRELGLNVRAILLTHGHFDHCGDVKRIRKLTGAQVFVHPADRDLPIMLRRGLEADRDLADGDVLDLAGTRLRVLHTPGHTPGSVCFLCGDLLFSGDTLFAGGCGRTDFPGGDAEQMAASLRRLGSIPEDLRVLPGHGESSTLNAERRTNYFMLQALYPEEFR